MKKCYLEGNVKIFYQKNEFKKGRETIVFVHGITGSSAAWKSHLKFFEKKYNVLAFDLRGHGKSEKPQKYEDYSFEFFAKDFERIIKHEKIKKFILVTHSFGVLISLEYLKKNQKFVSAAVFLSPAFKVPVNTISRLLKIVLNSNFLLSLVPMKKGPGYHIDYSKYPNTKDWNIRRVIADVRSVGLKTYLWSTKQAYKFNAESFLDKIKIPVLLIHGKKDSIFPYTNSLEMNRKIKNSKLIILEDIDHILVLNKTQEICKIIDKWLISV